MDKFLYSNGGVEEFKHGCKTTPLSNIVPGPIKIFPKSPRIITSSSIKSIASNRTSFNPRAKKFFEIFISFSDIKRKSSVVFILSGISIILL